MKETDQLNENHLEKPLYLTDTMVHSINLGIVGGGRACKFFIGLLRSEPFPALNINIVGVCDTDPNAAGFALAKELGIYTTNSFKDLLKIEDIDSIIELTGNRDVLLDIIRLMPKGVGVLDHNISRLLWRFFDLDKRLKSVEQQLALEKTSSDFLIQQSTSKIAVLGTDFTIVQANQAYLESVKKPKEEVIGEFCYKASHDINVPCSSLHPEMKCQLVETLRAKKSSHVIHEHPLPDGQSTYCNTVTYPLKDHNGDIVRVIVIWRDIAEEFSFRMERRVKELESNLQKLLQEDRMISLGKLAASCAHEINNPIQGLLTFSHLMQELLAEGEGTCSENIEQFKNHLALMSRELERCGNIVSGLLSFSRESKLEYTEINLNEVLETVLTLTRHKMNLQSIELINELSPENLIVQGDANQLQQCFLNLIFNGAEAMPKGGRLRVSSRFDSTKNIARILIDDTGYGIPTKDLNYIFDPFFSTKEEGEATGLGLSIVYGIVKNHKGKIRVTSSVGKGSTFILDFPTH